MNVDTYQKHQQHHQQHQQHQQFQWGLVPMECEDASVQLTQNQIEHIYPPMNLPLELVNTPMLHPDHFLPPSGTFYIVVSKKVQLPGGIEAGKRCRGCYGDPALCTVPCQKQCPICHAGPHIVPGKGQLVSFALWPYE